MYIVVDIWVEIMWTLKVIVAIMYLNWQLVQQ